MSEFLAMKADFDLMKLEWEKYRNEIIPQIQKEVSVLKATIDGMQLSLKALADSQEGMLESLEQVEQGGKTSVGYDAIVQGLKGIETAITIGRVVAQPTKEPAQTPQKQPAKAPAKKKEDAMSVDMDVADIEWLVKGNQPATDSAGFAYAFVHERGSTEIKEEVKQIYAACLQWGTIETADGYTIKLGGNKNNLLNRSITKRK